MDVDLSGLEKSILNIAIANLEKVKEFDPFSSYGGVRSKSDFIELIDRDPAFSNIGLGNDRYVMARIGGNLITSLHRKIGDMYENIFSFLLREKFNISEDDLHYSVDVKINDRVQTRSTDGMIPRSKFLSSFPDHWKDYDAVGFELRSCYQIGDSKRIQADYDMALALRSRGILPVMLIFCNTSLKSPVARLSKSWELYQGEETFGVIRGVTEFDLFAFMQEHKEVFSSIIEQALAID